MNAFMKASENSSIDLGISLPASKKSATSFKVLSRSLTGTYFGKGIGPKPSTAPAGYENISMTQQRTKTYVPRVGVASSMKMNRSPVRAQSLANHYHNQSQEEPSISELNSNVPKRSKSASVDYGRHTMNSSSYKVLEFLHCGPVETTLDISWLCSNKIAILVNLSDVEMAKNRIECYCENTLFHSPKEIAMKLDCLDYPQ
uniref:Uncharacterized protein n=1 Tax=Acrobeloides nanus TaxID=290746 RepID=A0A914CXW6_9BILA